MTSMSVSMILLILNTVYFRETLSTPELNVLPLDIIQKLNSFLECNINMVNFRGMNIDMSVLLEPVTLYRYFNPYEGVEVYPYEIRGQNNSFWSEYFYSGKEFEYAASLHTHRFEIGNRLALCKAEVSLDPPLKSEENIHARLTREDALITTSWAYSKRIDNPDSSLFFRSTSDYSILVYHPLSTEICSDNVCKPWIVSARLWALEPKHFQQLLIWDIKSSPVKVYRHCRYCNPCFPEMFVLSRGPINARFNQRETEPLSATHTLDGNTPKFAYQKWFYESRNAIISSMSKSRVSMSQKKILKTCRSY